MKITFELGRRSQLARGARFSAAAIFFSLAIASLFVDFEPGWMSWVFAGLCFVGCGIVVLWKANDVKQELEEEDLIEVARQAIHSEAVRLDNKRAALERILMSYGEWMEFPDFDQLHVTDWKGEVQDTDKRISEILDREADRMLAGFSSGEYWEEGKFQTRKLLLDLFGFMESIAQVYQPDAERPILETNLESLLKAINRASLQVILLLEEIPVLDVKDMNIRKASDAVRKASKVYRKYEELQPYLEPVRYLWQGSKFLIHSNPLLAAGWIAGSEILWKGGKKIGKRAMDAYFLSLVRQTLGILAWETAGIYDKSYRYRSPDWIYAVEIVHLSSRFELTTDMLRAVFRELGGIPLRSSYDRIFLYRCVANHVSPKPERFAPFQWVPQEMAGDIFEKLESFSTDILTDRDLDSKEYDNWFVTVRERLGIGEDMMRET